AAFVPPGSILERRARTILAGAHPDRTFVIMDGPPDDEAARIVRVLGLDLGAPCLPVETALRAMTACPLLPTVSPSSSPSSIGHAAESREWSPRPPCAVHCEAAVFHAVCPQFHSRRVPAQKPTSVKPVISSVVTNRPSERGASGGSWMANAALACG